MCTGLNTGISAVGVVLIGAGVSTNVSEVAAAGAVVVLGVSSVAAAD